MISDDKIVDHPLPPSRFPLQLDVYMELMV
jgi:hypothetical protein